jgi:uncharacterized membrane protein YidH (DUF202 family)
MEGKRLGLVEAPPLLGGRYTLGLSALLLASIAFTTTDFMTSFLALNRGFVEGNSLLTGVSAAYSLSTIGALLVTKTIFIAGISALAVVGAKSNERTTKKLMLASLTIFVAVFACVSANNLYWLVS